MATAHVDLQALRQNYQRLQDRIGDGCQFMAVVKADGYGHGMLAVAAALQEVGADWFGVGTVAEGKRLRLHGITGRIVILLGNCDWSVAELASYKLEPVVSDGAQLACLLAQAPEELAIHLKIDCGMGRLGFGPEYVVAVCRKLGKSPLVLASLMSHFPVADTDIALSLEQERLFNQVIKEVRGLGLNPMVHMANSAAVLGGIAFFDMVRVGLALYGYAPSKKEPEGEKVVLEPVMRVTSRVLQVKAVPIGTGISYGLSQKTERDSILAVIDIGYADGFPRALSGCGQVLIGGEFAKVIGRVCMNMIVVDVTDIASVTCGDEVVVIGRQGERKISATDIATWAGTINYEILCTLGNLNPREYV